MSRRKPPNNLTRRKPERDRALEQNLLPQGQFFIYQTFIPSSKKKYKQWNIYIQIATTLHTLGFTVGSNDGVERHSYHHYHEFHEIPSCYEQTRPAQNNESASDTESESDQDTDTDNDTDKMERDEGTAALTDTDESDTDGTDAEESESDHSESESDRRETILREIAELESELEAIDGIGNTDDEQ